MRNLKRALSLALSSVMLLGMMVVGTSAASYPDVDAQDNLEAIEVLQMLGVMEGDEKGNFNPDNKVTRNEMAVIMTHLLKLNAGGTNPFTDVPSWAQPYVSAIYANGVTSGTSATTYGGSNNVTAVEAALMVMKALGYFEFQGEFEDNWTVAVTKQATKIGLFEDVDVAVTDQITRSQAAQLCLNALESNVVIAKENGGLSVDGNGISVNVKPSYDYTPVVREEDYQNRTGDNYQQLCEKLYGNQLKKITTAATMDDFGRPSAQWTYAGEKVTAPVSADATYTAAVEKKQIYKDLGLSNTALKATVYTNGDGTKAENVELYNKTDKLGANGTVVEAYKMTNASTGEVTGVVITVIDTFASKVTGTGKNSDGDRTVKVDGLDYKTEAFAKDDIVIYTKADGQIKSMSLATLATSGEVTRMITTSGKESITIGGTEYKQGAKFTSDKAVDVKGEYDLYVDAYGYAVYAAETKAAESQYAVVLDVKLGGWNDGNKDAKVVLADGTQAEVQFKQASDDAVKIEAGQSYVVSYTVKDGVYTFDNAKLVDPSNSLGNIESGNAQFGDSKTVYVIRSGNAGDYTYTAYTGVKNVPDVKDAKGTSLTIGGNLKLVYVTSGSVSTSNGSYIYVTKTGAISGKDGDGNEFYTFNAVVDGKITTVDVLKGAYEKVLGGKTLFSAASYNKDGQVVSLTEETDGDKYVSGTKLGKNENETIVLGSTKYSYTDTVAVFVIDKDGKITESNLASVAEDNNDTFVATRNDKNQITALYVVEVAD